MIVPLPSNILIGPLILLRFIDSERLLILLQRIGIIAQFESMIIIPPPLHHTQRPSIRKSLYLRLIPFLKHELMIEMRQFMGLQIEDSNTILLTLKNSHLILTQHPKRIDIASFTKYFLI